MASRAGAARSEAAQVARQIWTLVEPVHAVTYFSPEAKSALGKSARPQALMQPIRGWTDEEWAAAAARMTERGLLGSDGAPTDEGAALLADVEHRTDLAAARPWRDEALAADFVDAITPVAVACAAELPYPNPIGVQAARTAR